MDGQSGPSILTEILSDVVGDTLCANENENFSIFLADLIEVLNELGSLLKVTADFDDLLNVVICGQFKRTNVDLDKIAQEVLNRRVR